MPVRFYFFVLSSFLMLLGEKQTWNHIKKYYQRLYNKIFINPKECIYFYHSCVDHAHTHAQTGAYTHGRVRVTLKVWFFAQRHFRSSQEINWHSYRYQNIFQTWSTWISSPLVPWNVKLFVYFSSLWEPIAWLNAGLESH